MSFKPLRRIKNFWIQYRSLSDRWHLFYNGSAQFHEVALGEGSSIEIRDDGLYEAFLAIAEERAK